LIQQTRFHHRPAARAFLAQAMGWQAEYSIYGPGSPRQRHDDRGNPSSNTK
jgi:hypothetical protein